MLTVMKNNKWMDHLNKFSFQWYVIVQYSLTYFDLPSMPLLDCHCEETKARFLQEGKSERMHCTDKFEFKATCKLILSAIFARNYNPAHLRTALPGLIGGKTKKLKIRYVSAIPGIFRGWEIQMTREYDSESGISFGMKCFTNHRFVFYFFLVCCFVKTVVALNEIQFLSTGAGIAPVS